MKKVFCFNNCACRVLRTNLVLVWFQCCPSYLSRKKGISGTFLSLGLRPRLQKIFPRFPFFYFGNLDNTSIRWGQICPRVGSTIIETKYYTALHSSDRCSLRKLSPAFTSLILSLIWKTLYLFIAWDLGWRKVLKILKVGLHLIK